MAAVPMTFDISEEPKRKVWTRDEVRALEDLGFFAGQRYELINGELIDKMGQKPPHAVAVGLVFDALTSLFGASRVRVQLPMELVGDDGRISEPEPDVAVTRGARRDYMKQHPGGPDLVVAVEISDTTVRMDRLTKAGIYARAGIPLYWVLDLRRRSLIVHSDPIDGAYRTIREFRDGERVTLENGELEVCSLLPDPEESGA